MSAYLNEVLKLNIMEDFKLICGQKGIGNKISKVGILDHELGEVIDESFIEGEFVLTNLLIIKDNLQELEDILHRLIKAKTSGLAIKTLYINELSNRVIEIAQSHNYPIFLYENAYYEDVITEVVDYIKESETLSDQMVLLDSLLNEDLSRDQVHQIAYKLNPDFRPSVVVCEVELNEETWPLSAYQANKILGQYHKCFVDGKRVSIIMSFEYDMATKSRVHELLSLIALSSESYTTGVSASGSINNLNISCLEAGFALSYALVKAQGSVIQFREMGMYQMLMPLKANRWVIDFCQSIMEPLEAYDKKNGAELIRTARHYVEYGGDIKKTAQALYQHGNTIRYRMDRIKGLLEGLVEKTHVDQELAIAIRWHELNR